MIFTTAFWKGLGERAIKTAAQSILAALATYTIGTTGILQVDWKAALSAAALTTLFSILTSIGNADFTAGTKATVLPAPADDADDEADDSDDGETGPEPEAILVPTPDNSDKAA